METIITFSIIGLLILFYWTRNIYVRYQENKIFWKSIDDSLKRHDTAQKKILEMTLIVLKPIILHQLKKYALTLKMKKGKKTIYITCDSKEEYDKLKERYLKKKYEFISTLIIPEKKIGILQKIDDGFILKVKKRDEIPEFVSKSRGSNFGWEIASSREQEKSLLKLDLQQCNEISNINNMSIQIRNAVLSQGLEMEVEILNCENGYVNIAKINN